MTNELPLYRNPCTLVSVGAKIVCAFDFFSIDNFLNVLYSFYFRVRDLSHKMGYGQGHMQMGLAEKKGLFT